MTALQWDQVGDRRYETGIDRGVLYLPDGTVAPWNGLTGIDSGGSSESESLYLDGVKFLERYKPGDFQASLKAFTYPDEFNVCLGNVEVHEGLTYHDQTIETFGLSYRTLIGNDVEGTALGYKIHLLYNLIAIPDNSSYSSLNESVSPLEFSWTLKGIPKNILGYKPTVHISIDSTKTDAARMEDVEELLYGTDTDDPRLPDIDEFTYLFHDYNTLYVVDNGDGTWTATDLGEDYITMLDSTTFMISNPDLNASYIDADTYNIDTSITD